VCVYMVYILYCIYNYNIYGIYQSPYVGDDRDDQGTRLGSINRPGQRLIVLDGPQATRLDQPS
jgi:hypothetical protein